MLCVVRGMYYVLCSMSYAVNITQLVISNLKVVNISAQ